MNGVDPYAWAKQTLERIANRWPNKDIEALMPWNFKPSRVNGAGWTLTFYLKLSITEKRQTSLEGNDGFSRRDEALEVDPEGSYSDIQFWLSRRHQGFDN